jgi:biotin-dependent carboxylase-like uncharacterized protein
MLPRDSTEPVFEVLAPGLLTMIQDAGRFGHRDEGVPAAGACDPVGMAVANLLIGNDAGDAALECTILGPELEVLREAVIGLGGADLEASVQPGGRRMRPGRAHHVRPGERIVFHADLTAGSGVGAEAGTEAAGCRAYLAVPGGIDAPLVLGSRSTSLVGGFGGLEGRPLRAGDRIAMLGRPGRRPDPAARWPDTPLPGRPDAPIRVLPGPGVTATHGAGDADLDLVATELFGRSWRVGSASDRRGLRLDGPAIAAAGDAAAPSHGVLPGTVQLTPLGQPLVLLNDGGTTGGYPVIGVVIAADLWRLGQARPGAGIRFEPTDPRAAIEAAVELREWLAAGGQRIRAAATDSWDDLADDAGA